MFSLLRTALAGDTSGGRLSFSITSTQEPAPPLAGTAAAEGGAPPIGSTGTTATAAGEAEGLLATAGGSGPLAAGNGGDSLQPAQQGPAPVWLPLGGGEGSSSSSSSHPGGGGAADDVAAAAEHHRLNSLSSSVDLRAAGIALERGLPYAALLLILFISTHIVGLAAVAYLSFVLFRLNTAVRSQVALKQDRQPRPLLLAAGVVLVHVPLALAALRRKSIAGNLILAGTHPPSHFWEVVFAVVAGDVLLRYLAVLAKVAVLLAVPADSPARFRRRGHILTAVEYCLAVYRHLPPAPLWYLYFSGAAVGSILSTGISGAYLLIKAQHCFECASLAVMALQQVAVRGFGSTPSADEIQEAGNSCPICQDSYRSPVKLSCNHIFCSDCCGEWFERERTCPMCRAAVGPANKRFKSFADGRTPLFPLLF